VPPEAFKLERKSKLKGGNKLIDQIRVRAQIKGPQVNASSSPYEGEDDFFVRHAQDDIALNASGSFRRVFYGIPGLLLTPIV
jgi:hypothetical protein